MTQKRFSPERGQFFWYIEEIVLDEFPDLKPTSTKFDPKKPEHKKLIERENCYLTEEDAFDSLLE